MRAFLLLVVALALYTDATAQPRPRRTPPSMLFGSLLTDRELQDELKLTDAQIKRMQEIYIQSQPPAKVIFSAWGIRELAISDGQLKQIREMQRDHIQRMFKLRKENNDALGGGDLRLYLAKRKKLDAAFEQQKLTVLTQAQWKRFEKLRGKPYKPFGKLPGRPKRKFKADI